MYRRSSADTIIEIIQEAGAQCGVYPHKADVFWFPQQNEENVCDGIYVLQSLLTELPVPMPFAENSAHLLFDMLVKIRTKFSNSQPASVTKWLEFSRDCPKTNDVQKYIKDHPLEIPLAKELFSDKPIDPSPVIPIAVSDFDTNIKRVRATDCVQWSRRGVHRSQKHPENYARVRTLYDENGNPVLVDALPKKVLNLLLNAKYSFTHRKKLSEGENQRKMRLAILLLFLGGRIVPISLLCLLHSVTTIL